MYIMAIDDDELALENLLTELNRFFPKTNIHGERKSMLAVEWLKELKAKGERLQYAFLDTHKEYYQDSIYQ